MAGNKELFGEFFRKNFPHIYKADRYVVRCKFQDMIYFIVGNAVRKNDDIVSFLTVCVFNKGIDGDVKIFEIRIIGSKADCIAFGMDFRNFVHNLSSPTYDSAPVRGFPACNGRVCHAGRAG